VVDTELCLDGKGGLLTYGGVFTSNVIDHDSRHHNCDDIDETCRQRMREKRDQSFRLTGPDATREKLARLEDEGAGNIHVPTIACWFDTLIGAQ
jgi:hypothetical protein